MNERDASGDAPDEKPNASSATARNTRIFLNNKEMK
jgi:hypothetical protein